MSSRARDIISDAGEMVDKGGIGRVVEYGFAGVILALFAQIIAGIQVAGETFLRPFRAIAEGLELLVVSLFGEPLIILRETAAHTAMELTTGAWAVFGPFTYAVGVLAVMAGIYVFTVTVRRLELRPWRLYRGRNR